MSLFSERNRAKFVAGLEAGERIMVTLRDELYEGSWQGMLKDLADRLLNKPIIESLNKKIERDIAIVYKIMEFEENNGRVRV